MDCYHHPGTASTATCVACRQPICPECLDEVAGHPMCRPCVAAAEARLTQETAPGPVLEAALAAGPASRITGPAASYSAPTGAPAVGPTPDTTAPAAPWLAPSAISAAATSKSNPLVSESPDSRQPGLARRIGRGIFWGAVYGQWWTLMTIISGFIWQHQGVSFGAGVLMVIFYGFFGSLAGFIIGAANASFSTGTSIGVGTGILVCLLEMALTHDTGMLVNLIFYFFTGRFVGVGITGRVQQPLTSKSA